MLRKIVEIDEAKCDGCGECISSCAEGAIALVGGKAKLVSDVYCDGLGACLGECPQGAIAVIERDAADFDEQAVSVHLATLGQPGGHAPAVRATLPAAPHAQGGGCPGSAVRELPRRSLSVVAADPGAPAAPAPRVDGSTLRHWPVQLALVPPHAPFLRGAHLLVAADCVPFAYASFHADLLAGKALVVGCPKLDDNQAYAAKLAQICGQAGLQSITVARMEVPCCGGIAWAAREAVARSGVAVTVKDVVIGIDGAVR